MLGFVFRVKRPTSNLLGLGQVKIPVLHRCLLLYMYIAICERTAVVKPALSTKTLVAGSARTRF